MGDCRLCSLVFLCDGHSAQILEFSHWLVCCVLGGRFGTEAGRLGAMCPKPMFNRRSKRQKCAFARTSGDETIPEIPTNQCVIK
jgi:hypothetical protein